MKEKLLKIANEVGAIKETDFYKLTPHELDIIMCMSMAKRLGTFDAIDKAKEIITKKIND